jgi:small-conductance mechanosensitive channel
VIFGRLAELPEVRRLPVTPYIGGATYVATILSITWVIYGLLKGSSQWYLSRIAPKAGSALDNELAPAIGLAVKVLLIFIAAVVILNHYNVELKTLLATAGAASLVLALAAQVTLGNMFAGFSILMDRPFRLGDRIELSNGRVGDVQEIGMRSTRILSPDNTMLIIPNSEIAKSSVINHSYPDEKLHVQQKLRLPYGSDVTLAKRILAQACREHALVLAAPEPGAKLSQLGDSAVEISYDFWIATFRQKGRVLDDINMAIYERLDEAGIKVVTPQAVTLTGAGERAAPPASAAEDQVRRRAG